MEVLIGTSVKIAIVGAILIIPLFLASSLFGKSDKKRGKSSAGFLFVFVYGALVLLGASVFLFGYDTDSQGAVFSGACLMALGFMMTMTRILRRR